MKEQWVKMCRAGLVILMTLRMVDRFPNGELDLLTTMFRLGVFLFFYLSFFVSAFAVEINLGPVVSKAPIIANVKISETPSPRLVGCLCALAKRAVFSAIGEQDLICASPAELRFHSQEMELLLTMRHAHNHMYADAYAVYISTPSDSVLWRYVQSRRVYEASGINSEATVVMQSWGAFSAQIDLSPCALHF
jgi:hypothetical protein